MDTILKKIKQEFLKKTKEFKIKKLKNFQENQEFKKNCKLKNCKLWELKKLKFKKIKKYNNHENWKLIKCK